MGEMSRLEQITFVANAFGCCSCVCEETFDLGDYCSRDVFRGVKESCVYIYIYICSMKLRTIMLSLNEDFGLYMDYRIWDKILVSSILQR